VTPRVVEAPPPERPGAPETGADSPATRAALHDGWWMTHTGRHAHRLTAGEGELDSVGLISVCGLSDRDWRRVAAAGGLRCGDCAS
jgi:hypothetical protein